MNTYIHTYMNTCVINTILYVCLPCVMCLQCVCELCAHNVFVCYGLAILYVFVVCYMCLLWHGPLLQLPFPMCWVDPPPMTWSCVLSNPTRGYRPIVITISLVHIYIYTYIYIYVHIYI